MPDWWPTAWNSLVVTEVGCSHGLGQSVCPSSTQPCPRWESCLQNCCFLRTQGCHPVKVWFPKICCVALPMELAVHSGHLYLPLSATCVVPSCVPVGEGVSSYHTEQRSKATEWRKEGFLLNCYLFVGQNGYDSA